MLSTHGFIGRNTLTWCPTKSSSLKIERCPKNEDPHVHRYRDPLARITNEKTDIINKKKKRKEKIKRLAALKEKAPLK